MAPDPSLAAVGQVLGELLGSAPYRGRWARHARRQRTGLNQAAVAHVIAAHLWDIGEVSDTDRDLPRRLKDPVSRALSGQRLTEPLLSWILDAFAMTDSDRALLWALRRGGASAAQVALARSASESSDDDGGAKSQDHRDPPGRRAAPPASYETVSVRERHRVGPERSPVDHETEQVIRATADLASYRYRFDTSAAVVHVLAGGVPSPVFASEYPGVSAVDITLTSPLTEGESTRLHYRTLFAYPEPPEPAFRRVCTRRIADVSITVEFDPECRPAAVWWCTWSAADFDQVLAREGPLDLDGTGAVTRSMEAVDGCGVGFAWEW